MLLFCFSLVVKTVFIDSYCGEFYVMSIRIFRIDGMNDTLSHHGRHFTFNFHFPTCAEASVGKHFN